MCSFIVRSKFIYNNVVQRYLLSSRVKSYKSITATTIICSYEKFYTYELPAYHILRTCDPHNELVHTIKKP